MTQKTTIEERGRSGFEIAGESFHLLRSAPAHVVMSYYIGSAPFILAFLYFWADMSMNAFAAARCLPASLGLVALFVWMKCWQAVFASGLRAAVTGRPSRPWHTARVARLVASQASTQPYGLILIPLAILITMPYAAVHGFYQNLTVLDEGDEPAGRTPVRRAWRLARLWPGQSLAIIWQLSPWTLAVAMSMVMVSFRLAASASPEVFAGQGVFLLIVSIFLSFQLMVLLCPFGAMVAGNIAAVLAGLPWLLKSLLGLDTAFTLSGMHGIINTTFLMTVFGLSYLCLDPLVKAAYTLRCFLGESRQTGEDLMVELLAAGKKQL